MNKNLYVRHIDRKYACPVNSIRVNTIKRWYKLFCLFFSFSVFYFANPLSAQNISIQMPVGTYGDVLKDIEERSDYKFVYNTQEIDVTKELSVTIENKNITAVLTEIFGDTDIGYRISNKHIVLYKKEKRQIEGVVTEKNGEPVIGANVFVKDSRNGTITDLDGRYSLTAYIGDVLQISYMGYTTQEVSVSHQTNFTIILTEDTQALEEVVIIGYGSAKKRDLTGAISSIKAENLSAQAPRNVQDLLRANAAGLNIGMATDAKGETSLTVRGKGTLSAKGDPLIVLDGVIYEGELADINPEDIATVDILKDASSAAVYGAKAANGVIAFTTKKGKTGKPIINFNANMALVTVANQPKILDANGFLKFRQDYNEGRNSDAYLQQYPQIFQNPFELNGVSQLDWYNYDQAMPVTSVTDEQLTTQWLSRLNFTIPEMDNYFAGNITRWDDLVFQTALQQNYTVSVSNATDYTSHYISLNWVDREGVVVGDKYQTFRMRANVETKVTPFLTVGFNSQYSFRDESALAADWAQMTHISPYGSNNIDDPESLYRRRPTGLDPVNPFYDNFYTDRKDVKHTLNARIYAQVFLPFGIEYTMNFTPYYLFGEYYNHLSSEGENFKATGGSSTRKHTKRFNWQVDNIFQWRKDFGTDHKIEATFLVNAEKAQIWSTTANAKDYTPNDILSYHALQSGAVSTVSSQDSTKTGDALMGRAFYSFRNKYMVTASVRRDGYSAFGKRNPRAVFPAVALGWTFTQENFMEPYLNWLSYGKLRFSWGENGNREIGQYDALARMQSGLRPYIDQSGNIYTTSQLYVISMANYDLKWERTSSYNIGLDFSLFNDILSGSIEAYISRTNDLLVERALPNITGYSNVMSNLGQLQNKGFELSLSARIIDRNDFRWNASGNFSLNRSKIRKLYGDMVNILDNNGNIIGQREADDETNGWFIGHDPDRIWTYERDGVWQLDEKDIAEIYGCQPGDFKYIDQNGDGIMDNKDKVFQGYKTPRFRWTLRNDFTYKDFTLSATIYSLWKYYGGFDRAANNYSFPDRTSDYDFPRWTTTNPINDYARIGSKNIGTNWVDKSFIRLDNITVSYQVPSKLLRQFSIQSLRLSISMQNLGVWAPHWNYWDPEPESTKVTPRTFNLGVNLTL